MRFGKAGLIAAAAVAAIGLGAPDADATAPVYTIGETIYFIYDCPGGDGADLEIDNDGSPPLVHNDANLPNDSGLIGWPFDTTGLTPGLYTAYIYCDGIDQEPEVFVFVLEDPPPTDPCATTTTQDIPAGPSRAPHQVSLVPQCTTTTAAATTTVAGEIPASGASSTTTLLVFATFAVVTGAGMMLVRRQRFG